MDQNIISNYLEGKASEEEVKLLFEWINSSPENKEAFMLYKKSWALSAQSKDDVSKAWTSFNTKNLKNTKRVRFIKTISKYAAAAVLLFSLGILTQRYLQDTEISELYTNNIKMEVPAGQMSIVSLPDGTTVYLNSDSKLSYPSSFAYGNRVVKLDGEGYFDVKTDKEHPFVVNTGGAINLKVYGTSFNVRAYHTDKEINATLVEGSIGITDNQDHELTRLIPGENAKYSNHTREIVVSNVDTDFFTSWKDGMVTFKNEPLERIALKIERWYNVEIIIKNEMLGEELYNGTIMKNKPIDQILEVFRLTSSLKYEIIPRTDQPTLIYWK
jgi:ferric-dicitrate binding protein FerR (iron transport regulator)